MKRIPLPIALLAVLFVLGGCTSAKVVSSEGGPGIEEARTEPAHGDKPRIAVKPFSFQMRKGGERLGRGLAVMLTDALVNTNRFIVLERERLEEITEEQDLADDPRFRRDTVAPKGEMEGAELIIRGSVVQFETECRGASLLLIGAKQACIGINLRIIDVATGRVVNATTVEGTSGSGGVGLIFTTSPMPIGLGAWNDTPMEKAMRQAIETAVRHIVESKL